MSGVLDRGICLRTWDWSETSQTCLILFRQVGLMRVIAKGSRREGGHFSGGIEGLTAAEARLFPKRSGGLSTLASWDLEERFEGPRCSFQGFLNGCYMAEVVSRIMTELDPHPETFDALEDSLREMDPGDTPVVRMQWAALTECGHQPDLDGTPYRRAPSGEGVHRFLPQFGRMAAHTEPVTTETWQVREETVLALRSLASLNGLEAIRPITLLRVRRFLDASIRYVLGSDIRSGELALRARESA
ncbi:MAG: DNA repair protein RecO [Phycisphaeraceae bacterium]|nr:DNA repair protein RecO [Phycisphaeraceae bacterium]